MLVYKQEALLVEGIGSCCDWLQQARHQDSRVSILTRMYGLVDWFLCLDGRVPGLYMHVYCITW